MEMEKRQNSNQKRAREESLAALVQEVGMTDPEFLESYQKDTLAYEEAERNIRNPLTRIRAALGSIAAKNQIQNAKRTQHGIDAFIAVPLPATPLVEKARNRKQKEYSKIIQPRDTSREL